MQNLYIVCDGSHSQSVLPKIFGSWCYLAIFIGLLVQIPGLSVVQVLKNCGFESKSLVGKGSLLKIIPIIHPSVCCQYQGDKEAG